MVKTQEVIRVYKEPSSPCNNQGGATDTRMHMPITRCKRQCAGNNLPNTCGVHGMKCSTWVKSKAGCHVSGRANLARASPTWDQNKVKKPPRPKNLARASPTKCKSPPKTKDNTPALWTKKFGQGFALRMYLPTYKQALPRREDNTSTCLGVGPQNKLPKTAMAGGTPEEHHQKKYSHAIVTRGGQLVPTSGNPPKIVQRARCKCRTRADAVPICKVQAAPRHVQMSYRRANKTRRSKRARGGARDGVHVLGPP